MSLQDKVAVITGGGRNIGAGISHLFSQNGAKLAIFDLDLGRATAQAEALREDGAEAIGIAGSVTRTPDIQNMVERVVNEWGHIDILVNCAAISDRQGILDLPDETWREVLEVTLTGPFLCSKYVAQQMVKQGTGGAIVNFSSTSAYGGGNRRIAYNAAKGGIISLTQSMAAQLAPHGIRVNAIAPGPTGDQVGGAILASDRGAHNLLNQHTMPEDQARVVLFLVSDESRHIIGQTIRVDAGGGVM
ncbi:MAG: SDR family oxidoreductase [Chloroflexi bacterium]|nr:SDR family oxidoreductase [Chloroflexota bacterium]